jgi:hypothetical protein
LDNKKVRDWAIFVKPKKSVRLGKKGARLDNSPLGQPLFFFFHVKGRKNGANFFFDNCCSHACFEEGIPGGELNGEIIIAKGNFQIGGVGAMQTKANDEWLVSVETTDGSRQSIQGLTIDKVTCDFRLINVERAELDHLQQI